MIDPKQWFLSHFPRARSNAKGDRLRHACPFHDDSPSGGGSFVMFLPRGNFVCKADSCAIKGGFPLLYKEVEEIQSWADVYSKLRIDRVHRIYDPHEENKWTNEAFNRSGKTEIYSSDTVISPLPSYGLLSTLEHWPTYLTERGYSKGDIDPYGLLFGTANEYKGFLVFPFWDIDGSYVSFTARKMSFVKGEGRYKGPLGNTNDQYLYGAHILRNMGEVKRIVVVEGQFDVLRLWTYGEIAVGISNKDVTPTQVNTIKLLAERHNCSIVVMLDGSASKWTTSVTARLSSRWKDTRAAYLPDNLDPDRSTLEVIKGILNNDTM